MAMPAAEIEALIRAALPDAEVEIPDLAGDGDHYAAHVDQPRLRRQDAGCSSTSWSTRRSAARMGGELHALQLATAVPN